MLRYLPPVHRHLIYLHIAIVCIAVNYEARGLRQTAELSVDTFLLFFFHLYRYDVSRSDMLI